MRVAIAFVIVFLAGLSTLGPQPAAAAGPNIIVLSPADGATIRGTTLTVSVKVTGFRLAAPVFTHPPVLTGFAGSLEYILDSTANYQPRRDLSAATTHTWTNVTPGHHTIIVRLATSQHLPWPNGPVRTVSVLVAPAAPPPKRHAGGGGAGVSAAPSTGGAADITHSSLTLTLWLLAALLILLGLVLLGSRMVLVPAFARRQSRTPRSIAAERPAQALSVLPGEGDRPLEGTDQPSIPSGGVFPADDPIAAPVPAPSGEPTEPAAGAFPPIAASGEPSAASFRFDAEPTPAPPRPSAEPLPRDRAIEMARQWSGVVESLVRQLDEQEAERRRMLEHIRMLEDRIRQSHATREQLREAGGGISPDDLHSLIYLTDALKRDPDHIVNLAAIAQNAGKFHDLVDAYTRLREAISEP